MDRARSCQHWNKTSNKGKRVGNEARKLCNHLNQANNPFIAARKLMHGIQNFNFISSRKK